MSMVLPAPATRTLTRHATLSVVVRFHCGASLDLLDEALFSLAVQDSDDLEIVLAVQNPTPLLAAEIADRIEMQPWRVRPAVQVLPVEVPPGVDGRSVLMNRGIAASHGRYLAFLDYDDLIYPAGYTALISKLQSTGRAWAVGGCSKTIATSSAGGWHIISRAEVSPHRSLDWLCWGNFITVHSYLIDRARLDGFEISFDEELSRLEDYDMLLRLAARHAPDLSLMDTPVCEYRIRQGDTNTTLDGNPAPTPEARREWQHSHDIVAHRKERLTISLPMSQVADLIQGRLSLEVQTGYQDQLLARNADHLSLQQRQISEQSARIAELELRAQEISTLLTRIAQERATDHYAAYRAMLHVGKRLPRPVKRLLRSSYHAALGVLQRLHSPTP